MHELEAYLNDTAGEPVQELYDYLRDETDYPLELIWKNMIRTMHPHDFTRNLALTRIIEPTVQDAAAAQSLLPKTRPHRAGHASVFYGYARPEQGLCRQIPATDRCLYHNEQRR